MTIDWSIQSRADRCSLTGKTFEDGEYFYTVLYDENAGFRREDLSEAAWKERKEEGVKPFSFWRSKFEVPPPAPPEALGKQTAEELLRRYMADNTPEHLNVRYILALMLERKRLLKEVETKTGADGLLTRIYMHSKTGEIFVIPDPQLHLDQIMVVQTQVAELLH
ncbi:MAG: hypothetical protein JWL90_1698 [Chthoniobacteraceae bacterium]|nr:hypothetical protein [Chthoniobacteraceae bacterium]